MTEIIDNENLYKTIVGEISDAGYSVSEILDLRYKYKQYKEVIPILIKWLPLINDINIKEEIVRALAIKFAKPALKVLINEFKIAALEKSSSYGWAIGNTISFFADDSIFPEILELVINKKYSTNRQMLVIALGNMKNPEAKKILIKLLNDDDVAGHAIIALRKMNAIDTLQYIEPFLKHPRTWWRREAISTINKFNKHK